MAVYDLLDYNDERAVIATGVSWTERLIGGDKIWNSGTKYRIRDIEHDPTNTKILLIVEEC